MFTKALELDPAHRWSHDRLVQTHEARGAATAARAEVERLQNLGERDVLLPLRLEARWGDKVRAKAGIDAATSRGKSTYGAVFAYAALGDADAAFKFLDHAFAIGHYQLVFLATDPRLDTLTTRASENAYSAPAWHASTSRRRHAEWAAAHATSYGPWESSSCRSPAYRAE